MRPDASLPAESPSRELATATSTNDLDEEARRRATEARQALEPTGERAVARYEPVDDEALGVTRRQFFNRGILTGLGLSVGSFGVASLAFLWPTRTGGTGAEVTVGSVAQVKEALDKKIPFYNAAAKTYIVPSPRTTSTRQRRCIRPTS